jgi:hypothetical protein
VKQQDMLQRTFTKRVLCTLVFQSTCTSQCFKFRYMINVIVMPSRAAVVVSYHCNRVSVLALVTLPPHTVQSAMLLIAAAVTKLKLMFGLHRYNIHVTCCETGPAVEVKHTDGQS